MVFNRGFDLPFFSSVTLLPTPEGRQELTTYVRGFLDLAARLRTGFILESTTWRASADWAEPLGLDERRLDELNREAIAMLLQLKSEYATAQTPVVVSGCIGPRGDGYDPGRIMPVDEAIAYHRRQAKVLVDAGADALSAITMTNIPEAVGIARAAATLHAPVVISFTVETNGRLPTSESLKDAIETVDAATGAYPAYYMINCAHPSHFAPTLVEGEPWTKRVQGVRADASRCSHAELDVMTELDQGDRAELAGLYKDLQRRFPHLLVLGGCCGTDLLHVTAVAEACVRA
jgi:S-methylmethionine-dependent homocysteine/selenocysteine methylase